MTTPSPIQRAVERAIEGGWRPKISQLYTWNYRDLLAWFGDSEKSLMQNAVLDPLFWQALGKAEGWGSSSEQDEFATYNGHEARKAMVAIPQRNHYHADRYDDDLHHILHLWNDNGESYDWRVFKKNRSKASPLWLEEMHSFIDHLASGHSPEEFFEKLLSTKD